MDELLSLLKTNRIFSLLDDETRNSLLAKFSRVTLLHGEILFEQGAPSDTVFLLASGKLAAEFLEPTGETRIVGHIDPGETVGEVSVLANDSRAMTVKALRESVLYKLMAQDFITLCYQAPAIMMEAVHPVITQSRNILPVFSGEKSIKHIVIVPANSDISLEKFSEKMQKVTESVRSVLQLSDYQPEFHNKNIDDAAIKEKISLLSRSKKTFFRILYILSSHDTPLARHCLKKADKIYIAAYGDSVPDIDKHIIDKIHSRRSHLRTDPELILLHEAGTDAPRNTSLWLTQAHFALNHHVRMDMTRDFHRLLRFIRGKANGLVLSGGGTRGYAHLGAIKAMIEAKIPIDIIGGTSVGALVAACYALHESYAEAYEKMYDIIVSSNNSVSWRSITWPVISLFNARSLTESIVQAFGETCIEDLWLPYFCVSSNLTNNVEDIHTSGKIWEMTRASASLPGLIPPMLLNGEIHLDGGLLNNLPVDVMRRFVGNRGKIIAVELNSFAAEQRKYNFPPILTFAEILLSKLSLIGKERYKYPRFIDTFLRGLFLGSMTRSRQNSLAANVYVSLDLRKYRLLHSNPKQAGRLIEIGYQETLRQIYLNKNKKNE